MMDELLAPLEREFRTGCQNASVFGGFHLSFLESLEEIEKSGHGSSSETFQELKRLFKDYEERPRTVRKDRIEKARTLLQGLKSTLTTAPVPPAKMDPLGFPAQYVKGVGPQVARKLERLGIQTVRDLITHYPRRHEDRRHLRTLREAVWGETQTLFGQIGKITEARPRRGFTITKMAFSDGTAVGYLTWYNQPYMKNFLKPGTEVVVYGKIERKFGEIQILNPEIEVLRSSENDGEEGVEPTLHTNRIVPIYPLTEGLPQTYLRKTIYHAVQRYKDEMEDPLPETLRKELDLPDFKESVEQIHFPKEWNILNQAKRRLIFEEFFILQVFLALKKHGNQIPKGISFNIKPNQRAEFEAQLPFSLTEAQRRVMREIEADMVKPTPMHRLLQGDVGSGKTVVSVFAAVCALSCGYQVAYMAPTEILTDQQGIVLAHFLRPFGISVVTLVGDQSKTERDKVLRSLQTGSAKLVIGTHALIQDDVFFHNLGLCIIDEQHKFGVMQRTTLKKKGNNPDILVMTATPIPRTMAMTLYGDLDVSIIDEMPPGRKPVKTTWIPLDQQQRVWNFIRKEVGEGKQAFIVCPLVEESEKLNATAAIQEAERLRTQIFHDLRVDCLHGKMKSEEKEKIMDDFRSKKTSILVSTTVIEVGVDIPEATVMAIENAERFGLSQLHQLRGRVGRGQSQAYCALLANAGTEEARQRLQVFCQSQDGFVIAEEDLKLRGPGEFYGTRQHGLPDFKIANLLQDQPILEEARRAAFGLVSNDPHLSQPEHQPLLKLLKEKFGQRIELI